MKQGIRQWFKFPSCCPNLIIFLFWSGVSFAVLQLSVKLSCAVLFYARFIPDAVPLEIKLSTDLNSISIFSLYITLLFCIWEILWSRSCSMSLIYKSVFFFLRRVISGNRSKTCWAFLFSQHTLKQYVKISEKSM